MRNTLLVEVAWEVCYQLGGIYTVLRSKAESITRIYRDNYLMIGPMHTNSSVEFEEMHIEGDFALAVEKLKSWGYDIQYGRWLIAGEPKVLLMNLESANSKLAEIKYFYWQDHGISLGDDPEINSVLLLGHMVNEFLLALNDTTTKKITAHFHEWMGGSGIPQLRRTNLSVGIVFTTHATLLGRYLAMNDPQFYENLSKYDWYAEASKYNILAKVQLERAAAHGSHQFTTVSEITALECKHLLGREVDAFLPNGINLERTIASHEFQIQHQKFKERIHRFCIGHFFPSYSFDLENTLYFFISGRYEFKNKGFDLTIEALARLNYRLRQSNSKKTIVCFFITKRPFRFIRPDTLRSVAMMQELRQLCDDIRDEVGERLFLEAAKGINPNLNDLLEENHRLRLRRMLYAWKTWKLPDNITHELETEDELLENLRRCNLDNRPENPVKVVYHPDFITATSPLFGMEYDQFLRGCHLGIFPSYYEPWGYTPLECMALGVPAITSNLSGLGAYSLKNLPSPSENGFYIMNRKSGDLDMQADELTSLIFRFAGLDRRARIMLRNQLERLADHLDWKILIRNYELVYETIFERLT